MRSILPYLFAFILVVGGVMGHARADDLVQDVVADDLPAVQVDLSGGLEGPSDPFDSVDSLRDHLLSDDGVLRSSALKSVAPIEPADDGSLKSLLLSFIGPYDPVVLEHEYTSGNGYTSVLREVQIDYPWLAACALLLVVTYCFFRTLGNIFGGVRK